METQASVKELQNLVAHNISEMTGYSERRFADLVTKELNHQLLEADLHGIQRRFALEKIRHDLELNYQTRGEESPEFFGLEASERYHLIQPSYMDQILDPEISDDLISVWVDRMMEGSLDIPRGLPQALGQYLVRHDLEWASKNLNPDNDNLDMTKNRQLFIEVLERTELI